MSEQRLLQAAFDWLAARDAYTDAKEAWRTYSSRTNLYEKYMETERALITAVQTLSGVIRELPYDASSDNVRIAWLRTENERLRDQVSKLRGEVNNARENNERRNKELDILHYIWCDGGCYGGAHRYCGSKDDITEDVVALAERNTKRLRTWFNSFQYKKKRDETP